ncbi:MAG TPA: T9SS type A sorting domain-containing protein, partial [Bacteroidia bacterium]|nr:T9SS type A sorting domain-containing protein [Bacteroidia bacterium]
QANLVLTNEVIEQTDSFVFETIGDTIYVNAKNIELNGNITVDAGFKAALRATKNITAKSSTNTQIGQDIRLKNVKGFSSFDGVTEMTDKEVIHFCRDQDNGYKAVYAASKMEDINEPDIRIEPAVIPKTLIYPNPATNAFYIEIGLDEEKEYNFQIFDLTGRTLINETVKGSGFPQFEITTDRLSGGTYFLKIATADGVISETHKIVILK